MKRQRLLLAVLATSACASVPPQGSLDRIQYDQRRALAQACVKAPDQFGYPYTRAALADLLTFGPGLSPNVRSYCNQLARLQLR